ncbi:hypothetical protein CEUSTIGMA_g1957.t1 [Chlamydomonas eustigma]|uniref:Cyclic nucleotide-binding domain-containing protein n=1 Tax=Chlamydomonas eustigma TaxID=1157962 RepID=A0A250WUL3_9CHLO|nr:hypothetical protein CEUSTIGMA_g1957.t1 [Chlamydomonas eustigma]|eukprot:GAX74508.1 hypothetical protein CEUSTIGMA_g1957.t1 [Chlamydomonas eustigma]
MYMKSKTQIVMLITHWVACTFWWEARAVSFDPDILVGVNAAFMGSQASFEQYVVSLYWAVTTLSMVEANSAPETLSTTFSATARASLFLLFNITLGSYVLGTITLLVVKQDERTGKYRDQSANLREFTSTHSLPADLKESLQEHLRLHFDTSEASEEQVLSVYPTAIRRRILRFLYLKYLKGSYLFEDAPPKLLDALLAAARVETFMPNVDIVGAGDYVNELLLLVSGTAEIRSKLKTSQDDRADEHIVMTSIDDPDRSLTSPSWEHDGKVIMPLAGTAPADGLSATVRKVGPGELLGEAAFFTEVPQLDAISSSTVCRVLVISRAAYQSLERAFPVACRNVWSALQRVAETTMNMEFLGKMRPEDVEEAWAKFNSDQLYTWASAELDSVAPRELADAESLLSSLDWDHDVSTWSLRQQLATANLMRIRACVQAYIIKQEADRTAEFLNAASMGNIGKIREMLLLGCPPNSADYDGRCALELACVKGHVNVVKLLLASGANPSQRDNLGLSPLAEACKLGHDELIDILVKAGATMTEANNDVRVEDAKKLCSAVFVGDLPQVKRLLRCGLSVDAGDYDKRTALHIAAAEGNLTIVRVLVEGGNANIEVKDRWGFSPLDEAMRVRAGPVIEYLERIKAARVAQLITSSASFIPASAIDEQQAVAAKPP